MEFIKNNLVIQKCPKSTMAANHATSLELQKLFVLHYYLFWNK